MFSTADYYLGSEVAFRKQRNRNDWKVVNGRRRRAGRRRYLRLPKQPHLRVPKQRQGASLVA